MEQPEILDKKEPEGNRSAFGQLPAMAEILFIIFLVLILGWGGSYIAQMIAQSGGYELEDLLKNLADNNTLHNRNLVRFANMAVHLMSFTVPCLLLAYFIRRGKWYEYLSLEKIPSGRIIMLSALLILVAMPFTSLTYWINMQVPLPEWAVSLEDDATEMINALLTMDGPVELLLNLLIIALIPAIGEELLFRGVFQKVLTKTLRNDDVAIWVTAFLFSMMHMQFEGFIPRFLLGAILGYLFSWSRNLWVPIAAHFFFNGIQVVVKYLAGDLLDNYEAGTSGDPGWLLGLASLVLTLGLAMHIKRTMAKEVRVV